jgi:hypothetical protein
MATMVRSDTQAFLFLGSGSLPRTVMLTGHSMTLFTILVGIPDAAELSCGLNTVVKSW